MANEVQHYFQPLYGAVVKLCARPRLYAGLTTVTAMILLLSAGMKADDLISDPLNRGLVLESRALTFFIVELEVAISVGLVLGGTARPVFWVGITWFVILGAMSFAKLIFREPSCGCMGRQVMLDPVYSTLFNVIVVVLLWYWRPLTIFAPTSIGRRNGYL